MFLQRFAISEQSMSPALAEGDYLVTVRRRPTRGDIIVLDHPGRPGFRLVKRVVAIGAATFEVRNGVVLIDGRPADEPWTADLTSPDGRWEIPPGHLFVLGDARHRSTDDSRTLGPLPIRERADVVRFRYWPLSRFGPIRP